MPFSMRAIGRPLLYWRAMESHAGEAPVAPAPLQVSASGRRRPDLDELFRSALFLGVIGFGGSLSVLANIESHVVTRKRWLTDKEFSNAVTVSQMLPGGAAANAIAYIGLRFGGWRGALLGYAGFCLPGLIAVLALAWAYVRFGTTPKADVVLGGFNAAVVGIIASITLKMVRTAVSRLWQMGVAAVALLFSAIGNAPPGEIVLGAYGGGFAIVPHLKQVIQTRNWITEKEFAEAVAIGKLTPGPVLLLATFIGYVHRGLFGAMVATVGIFSAPFLLVVVAGTTLDRLRSRRFVRARLRGLTPAVLGLMAAPLIALRDTLAGEAGIGIAPAPALALARFPPHPALMLLI